MSCLRRKALIAVCFWAALGVVLKPGDLRAQTPPTIVSLSSSLLPRSGRLLIQGSGFGATQGSGTVEIGGIWAPLTRWSDTLIAAYVPEAAPLGSVSVQVLSSNGPSNVVSLDVTTRSPSGRVQWRFQADSSYILQRPAVGSDGTIVAHDSSGFVYALQPDGGLKWIFKTPAFAYGPPTVGADGSVYVASLSTVYALNAADGTLKWQFSDPGSQGAIAGPTVGPDGNVYVVDDLGGLGAIALSPTGQLLWTNAGNPPFAENGQLGAEVVFGPSSAGGAANQLYVAFDERGVAPSTVFGLSLSGNQRWAVAAGGNDDPFMQQQRQLAVGPDGTLYLTALSSSAGSGLLAFDAANGALKWSYFPWPANGMSPPDAGPNGVIYLSRSLSYLDAVDASGVQLWQFFDGAIIDQPAVSPTNGIVFTGGRPNFGVPGFVRAHDAANGQPLWSIPLGSENGGNQIMYSRPRFSGDGQAVYFGTTILGSNTNVYSYLYAVDASAAPGVVLTSLALSPTSVAGGATSQGTVALSGPAPAGGALVSLSSSNQAVAAVPASVIVPAEAVTATFTATTSAVNQPTSATVSASYAGTTRTATLAVNPTADTVTITRAVYTLATKKLAVRATSTSAMAVLSVYVTATGQFIGRLNKLEGGNYGRIFSWETNPRNITVKSSLGGAASSAVVQN